MSLFYSRTSSGILSISWYQTFVLKTFTWWFIRRSYFKSHLFSESKFNNLNSTISMNIYPFTLNYNWSSWTLWKIRKSSCSYLEKKNFILLKFINFNQNFYGFFFFKSPSSLSLSSKLCVFWLCSSLSLRSESLLLLDVRSFTFTIFLIML